MFTQIAQALLDRGTPSHASRSWCDACTYSKEDCTFFCQGEGGGRGGGLARSLKGVWRDYHPNFHSPRHQLLSFRLPCTQIFFWTSIPSFGLINFLKNFLETKKYPKSHSKQLGSNRLHSFVNRAENLRTAIPKRKKIVLSDFCNFTPDRSQVID